MTTLARRSPDDFVAEMAARRDHPVVDPQHGLGSPAHVGDNPVVRLGVEAAGRLTAGHHYADWIAVGRALAVGRTEAMREAHTNKPEGRLYAAAFARWLTRTGLDKLIGGKPNSGTRSRLLELIDHLPEVEKWRGTLPTNKQLTINHPDTVYRHWKKSTVVPDPNQQIKPSPIAKLKESVVRLEEENHLLKSANGGSNFNRDSRAVEIFNVLVSELGLTKRHKFKELHRLMGEQIKNWAKGAS